MRQKRSKPEDLFAWHLKAAGIRMEREYRFHSTRRWRFDFADPGLMVAVEVEGVTYEGTGKRTRLGGRHVSINGFEEDCQKYGEAAAIGWRVIRVTPKMVKSGQALSLLERALGLGDSALSPRPSCGNLER